MLSNYDGSSDNYLLDLNNDGLEAGQVYRIRLRAQNSVGWGQYSYDLLAALSSEPQVPEVPTRDENLSTETSIAIYWNPTPDNQELNGGKVTGYNVYMAQGNGLFKVVFRGSGQRTTTSFIAEDLQVGNLYRFKTSALNFNGEGALSGELQTYACLPPSALQAPQRVDSTDTSFTLAWTQPETDGGCPILGYAVYRNDGAGGPLDQEVNTVQDNNVRDKPSLRKMLITNFPADSQGLKFTF